MENTIQTIQNILTSPVWGFIGKILLFAIGLLWLALVLWTLKDARKRIDDWLVIIVAVATSLVFPFIGTLVYSILRPAEYLDDVRERDLEMQTMEHELTVMRSCPSCREPVRDDYLVCPHCRKQLRSICPSCGRLLDQGWKACPFCAFDLELRRPVAANRPMVSPGPTPPSVTSGSSPTTDQATQLLES